MILYQGTAKDFINITDTNQIIPILETVFKSRLGRKLPPNELSAYTNSLPYMGRVLRRSGIADDCGVLIEYIIPLTSNRIDFLIAGEDTQGNKNFIIIELKQWQSAEATKSDGLVRTFLGGSIKESPHPSYQAQSYKHFMSDFNEHIADGSIRAYACACLHNYPKGNPEPLIEHQYIKIVDETPLFFRDDQAKLEQFLTKYVNKGKGANILYAIDRGKIRPTKKLIEHVSELFKGNQQFVLLDEQKVAFEMARTIAKDTDTKSVVIIKGGPGTGKSVISVNLLGQLLKDKLNAIFIAPNSSFRDVMVKRLAQEHPMVRVRNLFKGSGGFVKADPNTFDVMIVDEAHRLKKQGAYMYQGKNQVEDIIRASKTTIFFIDDDQAIRPEDIGSVSEIKKLAAQYKSEIYEIALTAQFRCAGAEGYINWLSDVLQIKQTANFDGWDSGEYDFKIFDDPNKLREAIKAKHEGGHSARVLAGYAWKWTSATEGNANSEVADVEIPQFDFSMPWNSRQVGTTWAVDQSGIHQAGCIHTSQGLEFDYVGVIVGADLTFNTATLTYNTNYDAYKDTMGKRGLSNNPTELNRLVRNIYKVLMTRGMKGCYVYFVDKEVEKYFRSRMAKADEIFIDQIEKEINESLKYTEYLPVYTLAAACGNFGEGVSAQIEGWIKATGAGRLSRNMFVTKVTGKSMEPLIPDQSYCLFRTPVVGSRNNKIVLVQHNSITDPDTGGKYTVKKYTSKKRHSEDNESFVHEEIILHPLNSSYKPITIPDSEQGEFMVIAEFIKVIS